MGATARSIVLPATAALALLAPRPAPAQDGNITLPVDSVEYLLAEAPFDIPDTLRDTRFEGDRTQRVSLWFDEWTGILVKWAAAPPGGEEFNNNPRYEVAAYELQKLFLPEEEYVVPPTIPRMIPLSWYRELDPDVEPTFRSGESSLVVLQYFLYSVTDEEVFDPERFQRDTVYARHWANVNLLTHFIDHKDANEGNLLISVDPENPRVFAVDNGVAFRSDRSNRGTRWGDLQVERFPRATVERLRALTEEELHYRLGVLAQFREQDGVLVRMPPGVNLRAGWGIRERDGIVQIGLTRGEIRSVWGRIQDFLEDVDDGRYQVF